MSKESENRINYLLKKYDNHYTNGEQLKGDYLNSLKNNYDLQWRIDVLNQLCNDCGVSKHIRDDCIYWLNKIKNPQKLRGSWTLEKCLSVIIINQIQFNNPKENIESNFLWKKYNFTYKDYTKARSKLFREILTNHVILRDPDNFFRYYNMSKD